MTMTTIPSIPQKRRRASQRKAVYGHDHLPFPFQKKMTNQDLVWGFFVKKKGLSIYCQSCSLPLLRKGSGGGHDQGWRPWSDRAFFMNTQFLLFWERERGGSHGHTQSLLFLKKQFLLVWESERGGGHDHTEPFLRRSHPLL